MEKQVYEAYYTVLRRFCIYNAELSRMTAAIEKGTAVDSQLAAYCCLQLQSYKEKLLKIKTFMGFDDGLTFMTEDSSFIGFDYEDGKLKGSDTLIQDVYETTEKWIKGFPKRYGHFQFEIALLLRTLANPDFADRTEIYPREALKDVI